MPKTPLMAELQITQEYFGQSTHLVYLAPMWQEFLRRTPSAKGPGSPVSAIVDGTWKVRRTGIAGVANTGRDQNWTGHDLAQANWYAFGRLAWNPRLTPQAIADEWVRMTWGRRPTSVATIRSDPARLVRGVCRLHDAARPAPPDRRRSLRADARERRSAAHRLVRGVLPSRRCARDRLRSHAQRQRRRRSVPLARCGTSGTTRRRHPESLLLWFHHLPWDVPAEVRRTLWDGLVAHYTPRRRARRRARAAVGNAPRARWMRSASRQSPPGCGGRSRTPPPGVTSASRTSTGRGLEARG